jgi:hypothetical protein
MKLIGLLTTKSASTSPSLKDYIVDVPLVGISTTESRRPDADADVDRPRPPLTFTRLHEASTQTTTTVDTRSAATADNSQSCQTDESEEADANPANQQCDTGGGGDDEEGDDSANRADGADASAERSGGVDVEGDGADRVELRLWDDFVVTADYQAIREAMTADDDANEAGAVETEWRVTADELVFLGFGIHAEQWSRNDYRDAVRASVCRALCRVALSMDAHLFTKWAWAGGRRGGHPGQAGGVLRQRAPADGRPARPLRGPQAHLLRHSSQFPLAFIYFYYINNYILYLYFIIYSIIID